VTTATTKTRFLGKAVAVRANWDNEFGQVLHLVHGQWRATGQCVVEVGDMLTALRFELEAKARAAGRDLNAAEAEIDAAISTATSQ
jgi:hypothetical protein